MKKFTEWLEKHQDNKCRKCPMYWSDGWYGEQDCYIAEGRYGKFLERLQEKLGDCGYGGCFIPMFVIKLVVKVENVKEYFRYREWENKCPMHTKGAKNCEQCKNEMCKGVENDS